MKKGMALCVVLVLLLLYIKPPEKTAASLGNIFVWYSDQSIIGRWSQSSIKIYANKLNTNATFYFDQAFTTARSEWQSALGIYLPIKPLENECPIRYYGGTVAELTALGWTVSSYTAGTTELTSISMEGYWYLLTDGSSKAGYLYSLIRGYIVDKNKPWQEQRMSHYMSWDMPWDGEAIARCRLILCIP